MIKNSLILIIALFLMTTAHAQPTSENPMVILETNQGNIKIKLYSDIAPKTTENCIGLVKKGYYNGTIFHRVIKDFMVQGGDPTGTGRGGESLWGGNFEDEFSPNATFNHKGLLAMANRGPGTNGSQFFITTSPSLPRLNNIHTIFGEIVEGYDVVEKIQNSATDGNDRPVEEQKIIKAYVVE